MYLCICDKNRQKRQKDIRDKKDKKKIKKDKKDKKGQKKAKKTMWNEKKWRETIAHDVLPVAMFILIVILFPSWIPVHLVQHTLLFPPGEG